MKKTLIAVAFLFAGHAAMAQEAPVNGGAGHFRFGYANYQMKGMNNWLNYRYPQLRNDFVAIGGGGYGIINNLVIGGEGLGARGTTVTKDTISITPVIGSGMFNLGYLVYHNHNLLVYPMIGIGGLGASFKFSEVDNPESGTNHVKSEPYNYSCGSLVLGVLIGADKFFMLKDEDGGISVSLKAGYNYAFRNGNWKQNDVETGGPNVNLSGFYITLGFGGGGFGVD
jgi:hypothetical protein